MSAVSNHRASRRIARPSTGEGTSVEHPPDGLTVAGGGEAGLSRSAAPSPCSLLRVERDCGKPELFEEVLRRPGVQIERIISRGHTTPAAEPYVQNWDEWVLVLTGSARLKLAGSGERFLAAGEYLLIPAGVPHWVTYTADPTIWLTIHFSPP